MERENQRVAISKQMMKGGLLRLLQEKDLEQINVSELCRAAGVNRATFYRHYDSPREVVLDIAMDMYRDMQRTVKIPANLAEGEIFLEALCDYFYRRRKLIKILIRCNTDEDLARIIRDFGNAFWEARDEVRELQGMDKDSVRLAVTYLGYGGYYLLRQWIMEDIPKSSKEIARLIQRILTSPIGRDQQ